MNTLKVQTRDMETKAKRLRREGYITGNLFGKKIKGSIPIKVKRTEAEAILSKCMVGTQIMLDVEGTEYDVLIKEMDYDTLKKQLIEVDFQALVRGEKVHSVAEIVLHNKEKVVEGVLEQLLNEVSYKAMPADLVDKIEIDAGTLRLGDSIKVKDLDLAKNKNVDILTNLDATVVNVIQSHVEQSATEEETEE